jgi:hypothetical protein
MGCILCRVETALCASPCDSLARTSFTGAFIVAADTLYVFIANNGNGKSERKQSTPCLTRIEMQINEIWEEARQRGAF